MNWAIVSSVVVGLVIFFGVPFCIIVTIGIASFVHDDKQYIAHIDAEIAKARAEGRPYLP